MSFEELDVDDILAKKTITDRLPDDWPTIIRSHTGVVYILKLEQDKYYVGWTDHLIQRMTQHWEGRGCDWTRKYPPLECLWLSAGDMVLETKVAAKCRQLWGEEHVGGGRNLHIMKALSIVLDSQRRPKCN